jgi:general stress protein 26
MNITSSSIKWYILALFLLVPPFVLAQIAEQSVQKEISRDSVLALARTIMDSARCRVLITVDENGRPHAREMAPFAPEDDYVIWLGTSQGSRKTKQIQRNPNVVVFYYETRGMSYVAVSGRARLVNDAGKKAKFWRDDWKQYYPNRDTDYILIKVDPEQLEVCSYRYKLFWDPVT